MKESTVGLSTSLLRSVSVGLSPIDSTGIGVADSQAEQIALAFEQTADILDELQSRVLSGLQPDGSTNRDVKPDVGVAAADTDGRREFGCMARSFTPAVETVTTFNYGDWELASKSGNFDGTPSIIGITNDGSKVVTIRRGPVASPRKTYCEIYTVTNNVMDDPAATLGTWNEVIASGTFSGRMVIDPTDTYAAFFHYGGGSAEFIVVQLSDGTKVGNVTSSLNQSTNAGEAVWVGDYVYWANNSDGVIYIYDLTTPSSPSESSFSTSLTTVKGLVVDGNWLYGIGVGGIVGIDATNRTSLVEDDTETLTGSYNSMDLDSGVLFMAVRSDASNVRVATVDVSGTTVTLNTEATLSLATSTMDGYSTIFKDGYAVTFSHHNPSGSANILDGHVFDVTDPTSVAFIETLDYTHASGGNIGPEVTRSGHLAVAGFNFNTESQIAYPVSTSVVRQNCVVKVENGGTALTSYTKGDVLVATAETVLGKLAVGADDTLLMADSAQAEGMKWVALSTIDHGSLGGLTDDDHTQYALLAGRSGGQTLIGGTAASDDLTLQSSSNATKGFIYLGAAQASYYDEVADSLLLDDGVVSAPGLGFVNDPDTGVYLAATGALGLAAGGLDLEVRLPEAGSIFIGGGGGSVTSAVDNFALGDDALDPIATGSYNLAIGRRAMRLCASDVTGNVGIGVEALEDITGSLNTAVGRRVMWNATSAAANTGIGSGCMAAVSTGDFNTGIGYLALGASTGGNNTAVGAQALQVVATASGNVAVGSFSLVSVTTNYATAIGYTAGRYDSSGTALASAANSVFIGYDARPKTTGESNQVVIGATARGNGTNTVTIGNTSITDTFLEGNLHLGGTASGGTNAANVIVHESGTAPTTQPADMYQQYAADWNGAGTAAPHFQTEEGDTIILANQGALTTTETSITHTAPGTPDYAIADLVDSGAGSAFGFSTKDEGNTVLQVIANLQTRVDELETAFQAMGILD